MSQIAGDVSEQLLPSDKVKFWNFMFSSLNITQKPQFVVHVCEQQSSKQTSLCHIRSQITIFVILSLNIARSEQSSHTPGGSHQRL